MTNDERMFARDIALLAKERNFTPGQVLAIFGVIAGHSVQFEVRAGRADQGGAIDTAIDIFTENMLTALDQPNETRQ